MPKQHRSRAHPCCQPVEGVVAGRAGSSLGATCAAHVDGRDFDRLEPEIGQERGDRGGPTSGAGLQSVVDRHTAHPPAALWAFERGRGRERE